MRGKIAAKFVKAGGIKAFGFPTTDEVAVKGGRASYFSKARIYYAPGLGAHFSRGKLLAKYLAAGGPDGYGLPQTDDKKIRGGYYAGFTAGRSIYFSKSTKAHLVYGNVRKKYKAMGYERGCLGFPTSDEFSIPGGRRNTFKHGQITVYATGKITGTC